MRDYTVPERGKQTQCPHCGQNPGNEHSLRRSGQCDGIRKGYLTVVQQNPFTVTKTGKETNG